MKLVNASCLIDILLIKYGVEYPKRKESEKNKILANEHKRQIQALSQYESPKVSYGYLKKKLSVIEDFEDYDSEEELNNIMVDLSEVFTNYRMEQNVFHKMIEEKGK